ncbi:MAG: ABC transporter permease [Ruminococcus sp.]|nr:ABC transporter permease [Ruminococcus sp.]
MGVFLKYISKNMLERKGRLFLLIFSIAVSVALLVASLGLINVFIDSFTQPAKIAAEGQTISLHSGTGAAFFDENDLNTESLTNLKGVLSAVGIINEDDEVCYVSLTGRKSFDKGLTSGSFEDVNDTRIIISDRIAKEYSLSVGSKMTVALGGERTEFTVGGIAQCDGLFYSDQTKSFSAVVPYSYLNEQLGAEGRYNSMTARFSEEGELKDQIEKFNDRNDKVKAALLVDDSAEGTESITMGLYAMLALVCVVCVIIIHGAFKLIITERLPIIGTFLSQGATRAKTEHILLMEAALYALAGSVFGVLLGELGLLLFTRMIAPLKEYGIYPPLEIDPVHIIIAVAFALLLSVGSAWLPARSIKKLQVKDVILNRVEQTHKKGTVRFIIGCVLLAVTVAGAFIDSQTAIDLSPLLTFGGFIGLAMMSRKFIKFTAGKLSGLFRGNTTLFLAMNNIKASKLLRGNITLMIIALSSVLSIVSIGASLETVVVDAYKELNADYSVFNIIPSGLERSTTDIMIEKLSAVQGIDSSSVTAEYDAFTEVNGYQFSILASDPVKFEQYMQYLELGSNEAFETYKNDTNRGVLVSSTVLKHIEKKPGDSIELDIGGRKETFSILGEYDGKLYNNGRTLLMKSSDMMSIYNVKEADSIYFRLESGADAKAVEASFKKTVSELGSIYYSRDELMQMNVDSNNMVINVLTIFSYLALIITAIGILNNISISFQQRRKEFAVIASIGMNGSKRRHLVLTESLTCVIWSIITAVPFTFVIISLMGKMFAMIDLKGDVFLKWSAIPVYGAVTAFAVLIASLSTMKKTKKLNIVAELKYE